MTGTSQGYATATSSVNSGTVFRFTSLYASDGRLAGGTTSPGPSPASSGQQPLYGEVLSGGRVILHQDAQTSGAGGAVQLDNVARQFDFNASGQVFIHRDPNSGEETLLWITSLNPHLSSVEILRAGPGTGPDTNSLRSFGLMGFQTDPSALPRTANYNGFTDISLYGRAPAGGGPLTDYSTGTAQIAVDFARGTLSGTLDYTDPAGDGRQVTFSRGGTFSDSYDLTSARATVSGTVNGNQIEGIVTGSDAARLTGHFDGGFFGPAADVLGAVGGVEVGDTSARDAGFGARFGGTIMISADKQ